ncbi:TSUP family transporter [Novosphingobium sp. FSY-8]|uniref:Probable membrane transporter protein n=1 Tax=Novosphingobium ovatum TaxID=1908523 RepID=A0ABW9XCT0_9SPHN|nr:TSUP family transporter [Novosphingobium ovatum]NBC36343.1 TSUP family transporter [Novosphingobium ovatum]
MVETWVYPALTAMAVLTGFIDSVAGGGGLLMMPTLIYAGVPPQMLLGTNKVQSGCGTAMAAYKYWRAGLFELRPNLWVVAFVFAGAAAGALVIQRFSPGTLMLIVPVLLMAVSVYTLVSPRMSDHDAHAILSEKTYRPVGGLLGFYDGFFGPGAGQFYATSLVSLRGLGLTRATGLTKLLNVTSNIASILVFGLGGKVLWTLGLCMGAGAMLGNWIGAHTATRFGAKVIRPLLVTCSLGMTARLLWGWFHG